MKAKIVSQKQEFRNAEEFYGLQQQLAERFESMQPELEVTVRDSETGVEGYVVVWNTAICHGGPFERDGRGMGKGGTRLTPGLTLEEIKMLARGMAEKNAAAGLPLGGAKSGARIDHTVPDYEEKYRAFVRSVKRTGILYEQGGIFGGFGFDVGNIPPKNAIWACEELDSTQSFTGKPLEMGGTDYDREGIAGLGVAVAGRELLALRDIDMKGAGFAVQGAGAMGAAVIRYFSEFGGVLQVVSDPKFGGTWIFESVPDDDLIKALAFHETGKAQALLEKQGKKISDDSNDVLYQETDILFPCALQDVIHEKNAGKVKARLIAEGANHPTTDVAHEVLFSNGVTVVPDIIANPGGVIAAYVELSSDKSGLDKVQEAKDYTKKKVAENTRVLLSIVDQYGVRPDKVGDYMAHKNIFEGVAGS